MNNKITNGLLGLLFIALSSSVNHAQTPGSLDAQFGTAGVAQVAFSNFFSECRGMALQQDGKIVLAGTLLSGGNVSFAFSRLNTNGTPDNTFGTAGKASVALNSGTASFSTVRALSNGKIIAAGTLNSQPVLVRINANGTADNTFGANGVLTFAGDMTGILDLVVLSTGKMVGCGLADQGSGKIFAVFRRNADGTADNTFGTNGFAYANVGSQPSLTRMAVQNDGKLVLTGTIYNTSKMEYDLILFRFTAAGVADSGFGTAGKVTTDLPTTQAYEQGNALAIQLDNKIVVAARVTNPSPVLYCVIRYSANGVLDNTFGTNGYTTINFNSNFDEPKAIAVQSDGKIVVAGATLNGTVREFAIARLTKTGALDNTFDVDGKVTTVIGTKAFGEAVALQPDGKIVVAGYATVAGLSQFAATRFNAGTIVGTHELAFGPDALRVFPNPAPAGQTVSLQFELPEPQNCLARLFGADGRLMRTYPTQYLPAGKQALTLDIPGDMPAGQAVLQLEAEIGSGSAFIYITR